MGGVIKAPKINLPPTQAAKPVPKKTDEEIEREGEEERKKNRARRGRQSQIKSQGLLGGQAENASKSSGLLKG